MFLSTLVLAASLAQEPAPAPFQSRVTLQVRGESGQSAESVAGFLALRDMLGSIAPNLVPSKASEAYTGSDRVVITVSTANSELVVINASGTDQAAVDQGLGSIVEHLRRFEPGAYRARRDVLDRARKALTLAQQTLAELKAEQKKFIASNGALDPTQRIMQIQASLGNRSSESSQLDMSVAELHARADYLRAQLERTPPTIPTRVEVKTAETRELEKQLEDLERLHAQVLVKNGPEHADAKASMTKIDQVRALLASRSSTTRDVENERYAEIEHKLYLLDGDLAQQMTRRDAMRKAAADAEAELARLTLIAGEYTQIWNAIASADVALREAQAEFRQAERQASGLTDGWFAVIAGPTAQASTR